MLFNSLEFLIFLPTVFLLYWFVFRNLKWQNLFVVVAGYVVLWLEELININCKYYCITLYENKDCICIGKRYVRLLL